MATISASAVKDLREKTGVGMMEAKKALEEANGDFEKAVDILRKKGLSAAAKKASRVAAEGMVTSFLDGSGKIGVLIEVNSETDFVAKNADFQSFAKGLTALVAAKKRGVDVRVITDRGKLDDPKQRTALETLRLAGIPIKVNRHDGLMHLKQVVVDDRVNTSGSMNQTASAARYNDERLDVFHDSASTHRAKEKFLTMWADHSRYEDWR